MAEKKILLRIENLKQYFPVGKKSIGKEQLYVRANDGISLDIYEGETLGLVGESGCGKSTFGRTILQLYHQTAGRTMYYGNSLDDQAPKYVYDILRNLSKKKEESLQLQEKAKNMLAEASKISDAAEKAKAMEKANQVKKDGTDLEKDIIDLIGGFYLLENQQLDEIGPLYQAEFQALQERRAYVKKLDTLKKKEAASSGNSSRQAKIKELEAKIKEADKKVELESKKLNDYRAKYKNKPKFAEYEQEKRNGINLAKLTEKEMQTLRSDLQLIFQDPYSSLNPRMTVGQIIGEGVQAHNIFDKKDGHTQDYIMQVMEKCGLASYFIHRYPHQFSGGQRQRIGIARSLAVKPKFVVCDEAVSALDVSIQSQIINLLLDLKQEENLTYLFISHDLSVIKYISDRIGVMYLGTMVELSETDELFAHPAHPYTEALLSAIPTTEVNRKKETIILQGDIPSPIKPPTGCKFHTRCNYCTDICKQITPELEEVSPGHFVACHHKQNLN